MVARGSAAPRPPRTTAGAFQERAPFAPSATRAAVATRVGRRRARALRERQGVGQRVPAAAQEAAHRRVRHEGNAGPRARPGKRTVLGVRGSRAPRHVRALGPAPASARGRRARRGRGRAVQLRTLGPGPPNRRLRWLRRDRPDAVRAERRGRGPLRGRQVRSRRRRPAANHETAALGTARARLDAQA